MVVWWYDFLEQKMYTPCAVRTACFDVYAIERLLKQREYVMYVISIQKRKSYHHTTIPQQRRSEDQKSAWLVVQKMKILLVWWYGGMLF